MNDSEAVSIYNKRPAEGQAVKSWISGQVSYASSIYSNGYFESYENNDNRFVIIRWKHDMWQPR